MSVGDPASIAGDDPPPLVAHDSVAAPRAGEFDRIARYFAPLAAGFPGARGLLDDAALIDVAPGESLVVTTDALVAGVHFIGDEPPGLIARKALRVNLSDLAAMGARPVGYTLALALPPSADERWLAACAAGLARDQVEFGVALIGGDSVATPGPITLAITAFGSVLRGGALTRGGARPGDLVYVSGTLGDAALGLDLVQGRLTTAPAAAAFLIDRFRLPQPRLALGARLRELASAAIDISDGLLADLGHIAQASGVAITIEAARAPLSPAVAAALAGDPGLLDRVLGGGDDYELALTVPPDRAAMIERTAAELGVALTRVGVVDHGAGVGGTGVTALDAEGRALRPMPTGYRHF